MRRIRVAVWISFAGLFVGGLALLVHRGQLPAWVLYVYLGASVLALLAYAWDKSAARADRWRVAESTLHWLAIVGGWPGAVFAQQLLRHKSSKLSFRVVFCMTIAINIALLTWTLDELGLVHLPDLEWLLK